jgi:hypothetical protein
LVVAMSIVVVTMQSKYLVRRRPRQGQRLRWRSRVRVMVVLLYSVSPKAGMMPYVRWCVMEWEDTAFPAGTKLDPHQWRERGLEDGLW